MRYKTQDPKYDIEVTMGGAYLVNAATGKPIPADEPIFLFRAKDKRAVSALMGYRNDCEDREHIEAVEQRIEEFEQFAISHSSVMSEPDSCASAMKAGASNVTRRLSPDHEKSMEAINLPVVLPEGWTAEYSNAYGTIITAVAADGAPVGYVTVAEDLRSFSLGMSRPKRLPRGVEPTGRGWKKQLYLSAIEKLCEALR